ncbi:hypothetical protein [Candidatus Nitrosocosmicus franklandus]|uniref:Uncharacterized protein n=1 Tax=Candidatus Nitrosocosmicus franklandianus TaxID=1798806 RepID=A0A484I487_9ARCH|nr:hypothetical protein [Candidatus Nitrosocosmicus franklandus]VFJ12475.1 conserved exported protein of unknown function [Candidatus Nitrosocosmicus franklandus]
MMKKERQLFLTLLLLSSIFGAVLSSLTHVEDDGGLVALASTSVSSPSNTVTEGNSTFQNSSTGVDGVSKDQLDVATVTIVPNPNSDNESSGNVQNTSTLGSNQSELSTANEMQRGEYLVDDNGVHYYNINNCSLVPGSSGIGNLSECEDAEREIEQELNG